MPDDSMEPLEPLQPMSPSTGVHAPAEREASSLNYPSWLLAVAALALVAIAVTGVVVAMNASKMRHDQDQLVCLDKALAGHQPGTALAGADIAHCH
jgi:hypothetical protein